MFTVSTGLGSTYRELAEFWSQDDAHVWALLYLVNTDEEAIYVQNNGHQIAAYRKPAPLELLLTEARLDRARKLVSVEVARVQRLSKAVEDAAACAVNLTDQRLKIEVAKLAMSEIAGYSPAMIADPLPDRVIDPPVSEVDGEPSWR